MSKSRREEKLDTLFTSDNSDNMRKVIDRYKNILVCGIKGVGKITHTVAAVQDKSNVYYIGNPVDHEGKMRPGSYEKYLRYILSLKKDMTIIRDMEDLFTIKSNVILVIDEIYGRSEKQFEQLRRLFDMENTQCIQIVGCLKSMKDLIDKIDIIVVLEHTGAFTINKEFGRSICRVLSKNVLEV